MAWTRCQHLNIFLFDLFHSRFLLPNYFISSIRREEKTRPSYRGNRHKKQVWSAHEKPRRNFYTYFANKNFIIEKLFIAKHFSARVLRWIEQKAFASRLFDVPLFRQTHKTMPKNAFVFRSFLFSGFPVFGCCRVASEARIHWEMRSSKKRTAGKTHTKWQEIAIRNFRVYFAMFFWLVFVVNVDERDDSVVWCCFPFLCAHRKQQIYWIYKEVHVETRNDIVSETHIRHLASNNTELIVSTTVCSLKWLNDMWYFPILFHKYYNSINAPHIEYFSCILVFAYIFSSNLAAVSSHIHSSIFHFIACNRRPSPSTSIIFPSSRNAFLCSMVSLFGDRIKPPSFVRKIHEYSMDVLHIEVTNFIFSVEFPAHTRNPTRLHVAIKVNMQSDSKERDYCCVG